MFNPRADSRGKDFRLSARLASEEWLALNETRSPPAELASLSSPNARLQTYGESLPAGITNADSVVMRSHKSPLLGYYSPLSSSRPFLSFAASEKSVTRNTPPPATTNSLVVGLKSIMVSGPVVAAIGSTIIAIPITTIGAVALGCAAAWTAANEFRATTRHTSTRGAHSESRSTPIRRGLSGLLVEMFYSPGFGPSIQAMCYLYSAGIALGAGNPFIGGVFAAFAIGACAAAHIGNLGYTPPARASTAVERYLERAWKALPERLRAVLTDPGACFCSGNLALILHQLDLSRTISGTGTTVLFALGTVFAAIGVARGLFPLLSGRATSPSGTASIVGGVGDISHGLLSLIAGNVYTGAATIAWGIANILYGLKIGQSFIIAWLDGSVSSRTIKNCSARLHR